MKLTWFNVNLIENNTNNLQLNVCKVMQSLDLKWTLEAVQVGEEETTSLQLFEYSLVDHYPKLGVEISDKPYNQEKLHRVTSMMQKFKWSTLKQRRILTDVTLMYKEVNQLIAVPISYQPSLATVRGTRNSHCLKFVPHHCRINVYQLLFFPWIIYYWNTLSESFILSPLLEQFKTSTSIQNLQHWTTCPAY